MKKQHLLNELKQGTFVMLRPSPIEGIGVFAIAPIAKGQRGLFSNDDSEWVPITKAEVMQLPEHSRLLIENFCLYDEEHYFVPEYGFKMIDPVIFLNHSEVPNVISLNDGDDFEAIYDIQVGEELLIDYGTIAD